jgi:hypothetical protein
LFHNLEKAAPVFTVGNPVSITAIETPVPVYPAR